MFWEKVKEDNITIPSPENFNAITGKGVEANVEGKQVKVVSPGYLRDEKITIPEDAYSDAAETVVFVLIDGKLAGYIALADEIRPESAEAIKIFKKNNIKVLMATGDNEKTSCSFEMYYSLSAIACYDDGCDSAQRPTC